ncbi:MAG: hypothetical protein LPK15_14640 [Alteromonadaceae bacterium]|uniref:hypothetical protein n=1 Tax=Marinobacter sp. TaxID=50741 RepID=UPI0029C50348|nr:hypothetical protein [Marinobacter sp.]MDX5385389.1 hypothetical protein [Marinobacter sp.]MDX5441671.1 hypothetical protein [Alteromonadaceae bacterium]
MSTVIEDSKDVVSVVMREDYEKSLERQAQDARLARVKVEAALLSKDKNSDVEALKAAFNYSIVRKLEFSDGHEVVFDPRRKLAVALEILVYANRVAKEPRLTGVALGYLCGKVEQEWKKTLFEPDLAMFKVLPSGQRKTIRSRIENREKRIKEFHTTRYDSEELESYDGIAHEIVETKNKFIVINGAMASGKTTLLREVQSIYKEKRYFPILITGRRTIVDEFCRSNAEDHYRRSEFDGERLGLAGVVNSIVLHRFENERKRCKVLIIDEVEDVLHHIATGTLGSSYEDRVYALDRLAELAAKAEKVIICDAMVTDHTINWFRDIVKAKQTIYTARPKNIANLHMQSVTESELLGKALEDVNLGRKVAIFCDYSASKMHEIMKGFRKIEGAKVFEISRRTLDKGDWSLETLDEILLNNDVVIITPIINAGVSITLAEYDQVYVLAGGTLSPTSLLQSVRRFRCAHRVVVAFRKSVGKRPVLSRQKFILNQLPDNVEDPIAEMKRLLKTESGKFLADYALNRSYQYRGFRQVFFIAAEQMGFELCHSGVSGRVRKIGAEAKRRGKKQTLIDQRKAAFDASFKWYMGALTSDDTGVPSERSFEQQVAHRTIVALQVLDEPRLTDELYELIFFHDLDRIVFTRMRLKRGSVASPHKVNEREKLASHYATALLEEAGVNFLDLSISRITPQSANTMVNYLGNVVRLETGGQIPMLSLFQKIFPNVNVGQRYKTTLIRECLKVLGVDLYQSGKSKGARIYSIKDRVESSREGGEYNLTKIADRYESLPVPKEISFHELIRQINNVGVADVWGAGDAARPGRA